MATIFSLELDSDDEDSEYSESDETESENEDEKALKRRRREERRQKEYEKLKERVDLMFKDMLKESDLTYKHREIVDRNDFMLQFHKKVSEHPKLNTTVSELERYMNKSSSRIFNDNVSLDIKTFKQQCYDIPNSEKLDIIKKAVISVDELDVPKIKTKYTFAGNTYEVYDKVDKKSKKYTNHLKKQKKSAGGNFQFLDDMLSELDNAPKLSAISKSEIDWNLYKDRYNLTESLRRDHKFIKDQAFLDRASWKEHEHELSVKLNYS